MSDLKELGFASRSIHSGAVNPKDRALVTPIYQTNSYIFESVKDGALKCESQDNGSCYTRIGNPTTEVFEQKIASLEGAEAALAFGTGVGAISSTVLYFLKAGDHCIVDDTIYSASHYLFDTFLVKFGVETTFVDSSNPENVVNAIKENTRIIYFETPANPTMKIIDLDAMGKIGKEHGIITLVDSTFASPYIQRPLEHGVDVVLHSATKYICGHGDAMGGVVATTKKIIEGIRDESLKNLGAAISPFNSYLMIRGLKTLDIRMNRHCENAMKIALYLEKHPKINVVHYPGLESHPQHQVAKRTMDAFGAVIAFDLKGGVPAGVTLMESFKLCTLAVSLGDVETLVEHPASMTHWYIAKEERLKGGITDGLVRLSVGTENVEDIIADLEQALDKVNIE